MGDDDDGGGGEARPRRRARSAPAGGGGGDDPPPAQRPRQAPAVRLDERLAMLREHLDAIAASEAEVRARARDARRGALRGCARGGARAAPLGRHPSPLAHRLLHLLPLLLLAGRAHRGRAARTRSLAIGGRKAEVVARLVRAGDAGADLAGAAAPAGAPAGAPAPVGASGGDQALRTRLLRLTKPALQQRCEVFGLRASGRKADMVEQLMRAGDDGRPRPPAAS
jgi:hypothetical protein